jgi:hypothetical protein
MTWKAAGAFSEFEPTDGKLVVPLFELHAAIARTAAIGSARCVKWFTRDLSIVALDGEGESVILTAARVALGKESSTV